MSIITVRLDPEEEATLDRLAELHEGVSNALRAGLRLLASTSHRGTALAEMLAEWDAEEGLIDEEAVKRMAERYGL